MIHDDEQNHSHLSEKTHLVNSQHGLLFGHLFFASIWLFLNLIGTQSVRELFFGDRSIRRALYSNDLVKFFCVAMYSKKETGNLLFVNTTLYR